MQRLIGRRRFLTGAGAVAVLGALDACRLAPGSSRASARTTLQLPPVRASVDRITRITVCTRPFRAQGPRLDVENVGAKIVVHNYGHGGSGWSLSWGSGAIATANAMATGERDIAVIGCGALGLTTALFIPKNPATSSEMISGLHEAFLVLGAFTVLSTVIFHRLKSGDGENETRQEDLHLG